MGLTLETAVRNAATDAVVDLIDVGAGANGTLEIIYSSGPTTAATLNFSATAFGASASGTATAAAISSDTNANGAAGAVDQFKIKDADGTLLITGTVTATSGGGDIEVDSTTINSGDTVTISSFSITTPAS